MSSFEMNKIFMAILLAGLIGMLSWFVSYLLVHPHVPAENAVAIEGGPVADGGGATKASGPEPILAMIAAADIARGEKVSKACTACHSFEKGGANKIGPNLWNVVGGPTAHAKDFAYSQGLSTKNGVWNYDSLNHFLYKPKAYIPDTKMSYIGLKKPEDRAAIIAWMRSLSDSPVALPSDSEIAAEQPPAAESAAEPAAEATETPPAPALDSAPPAEATTGTQPPP